MTMTVHSLQHLERQVIENGPLWANSLFPFEHMVKEIDHLYSETRHIGEQVSRVLFKSICLQVPLVLCRNLSL